MPEKRAPEKYPELHKDIERHLDISASKELLWAATGRSSRRAMPQPGVAAFWLTFSSFWHEISHELSAELGISEELASHKIVGDIGKLASRVESIEHELMSCKEAIGKLCEGLEGRPLIKQTELFDIGEDLHVIQPIPIVIEEFEGEVIASFPEIEVYAVADNEPEAISNLKTEIRDLYYELIGTPKDELGKLPASWLRIFERLIKKLGDA